MLKQKGHEADDVIASIVRNASRPGQGNNHHTIVSADHDLYQLLRPTCQMWNPNSAGKGMMTAGKFHAEYGISPREWPTVKAMAGCSSDEVPGIKGVGEKTAIRFLNHELPASHKTYARIKGNAATRLVEANMALVRLPFRGTKRWSLSIGTPRRQEWRPILRELGIKSL